MFIIGFSQSHSRSEGDKETNRYAVARQRLYQKNHLCIKLEMFKASRELMKER